MQKFLILSTGNFDRSTFTLKTKGKYSANYVSVFKSNQVCRHVAYRVLCAHPPVAAGYSKTFRPAMSTDYVTYVIALNSSPARSQEWNMF